MPYIRNHSHILSERNWRNIDQENSQGTISQILTQTANSVICDIALEQIIPLRAKMWQIVAKPLLIFSSSHLLRLS